MIVVKMVDKNVFKFIGMKCGIKYLMLCFFVVIKKLYFWLCWML